MEPREPIKFAVGEAYKNEKGLFEVVAIKGDQMVIRWESGEEMACDVRLQRRIQERRRWERQRREKVAAAKLRSGSSSKAGRRFEGLRSEDFQDKISRTSWRSRPQLGGAVTRHLRAVGPGFNSWAAKRRNAVYWADAAHWKTRLTGSGVRFSALAGVAAFTWGLHVLPGLPPAAGGSDGEVFMGWMADADNDAWLRDLALDADLKVYDGSHPGMTPLLVPDEAGWIAEGGKRRKVHASFRKALGVLPDALTSDLMIATQIAAEEAIDREKDIAGDLAELFERLLPAYRAVWDPGA